MTYQRNMCVLEDGVDQGLPDGVHEAEPAAGDEDEAQHDGRGLEDVLAVGPLHATELLHARAQERDHAVPALVLGAAPAAGVLHGAATAGTTAAATGERGLLDLVRRPVQVVELVGEDVAL